MGDPFEPVAPAFENTMPTEPMEPFENMMPTEPMEPFENTMPTEPMEPPVRQPGPATRTPRMSVQALPPETWEKSDSDQWPQPGPAFRQDTNGATPIPMMPDDEETGYLRVEVKTGRSAVPVPGAHVTISRLIDDTPVLYRLMRSNENGDTPLVPVPTPRQALSQSPGNGKPFATYNIRVQQDGFFTVQNVNVPVFSGIVAIQPVELIPFPENANRENTDNIIFESAPQDL